MTAVTVHTCDSGAQENNICHCFHFPPAICREVLGPDAMSLVFLILSFKSAFSLSSFTLIKKLFSSSILYAIGMGSCAHQRLLIFLPAVSVLACDSSSLAFHMMYSTYKLSKHGDSKQPCCPPFPILSQFSMFSSNCCLLTCKK